MLVSQAFPSKYVSAADLRGDSKIVTMKHVELDRVGEEQKPILYFRGTDKGLVLNKTNASKIAEIYGDNTDDWVDQQIVLFPTMTDYAGKQVEAVRVRQVMPKDRPQQRREDPISSGKQAPPARDPAAMDDDIPF